jgi:hypothetical protein
VGANTETAKSTSTKVVSTEGFPSLHQPSLSARTLIASPPVSRLYPTYSPPTEPLQLGQPTREMSRFAQKCTQCYSCNCCSEADWCGCGRACRLAAQLHSADATPFRALSPHNAHPQAHLRRDDAGAVGVVIGGITSTTTDGAKGKRL